MVVGCHMPYFIPYPGYFLHVALCDVFVILDSVQFPQGRSWVSRNLIKLDQGKCWLSIPVMRKGLGLQAIQQVRVMKEGNWARKLIKTFETAYKDAPYFQDHMEIISLTFKDPPQSLLEINLTFLDYILTQLSIKTEILLLSSMGIDAKEPMLSYLIAKELGAQVFLSMTPKKKYLNAGVFEKAQISLRFIQYKPIVYPQLWGRFEPNLSTLDLLFNCGPRSRHYIDAIKDRCIRPY
jgi:hypothetical protein